MAEQRVVVEGDLCVQGEQLVVLGSDERINLHQRSVGIDECLVKALEERHRVVDLCRLQSQRKGQLARLPCAEPDRRIDRLLVDGLGILGRDLFDLHAAGLRSHEHQLAGDTVEHDAQIELAVDSRGLLDEQALHLLALRTRLVGDELHAQDVLGVLLGFLAGLGYLHAAALAAASGVNLRLDDDAGSALDKQLAGHRGGFLQRVRHLALGHGNAVLGQDLLCLILVNLHVGWERPIR